MTIGWKQIRPGFVITEPGSARSYKTGDWRSERPVIDREKCVKCGNCYIFCPEGAVKEEEDGFYSVDLFYCKGCGICANECPKGAIKMIPEE